MTFVDLYLGGFLILCGFGLSLLNLRRILKGRKVSFPVVLLSENLLITCIGIAFVSRSIYKMNPSNLEMSDIELRSEDMNTWDSKCSFTSILMGYGPLIVSLVNSFLSLIIDNYMHYRIITDVKTDEEESAVRNINDSYLVNTKMKFTNLILFMKKYFSYITVALQWIVPLVITLSMYSIDIKEMTLPSDQRSFGDSCMAMLNINQQNCTSQHNVTEPLQLSKYLPSKGYLEMYEIDTNSSSDKNVNAVVDNVYKILANLQNETYYSDINVTSPTLLKKSKSLDQMCMKICFLENKKLLLYMFGVSVISYFVPITISTIILTKIHLMDIKNKNVKTYVNRELLYNILFWTPVMFDTFLSITLCSYSMNGVRTSIFNVIANVYQGVKNFMNTKYFKDNAVVPV